MRFCILNQTITRLLFSLLITITGAHTYGQTDVHSAAEAAKVVQQKTGGKVLSVKHDTNNTYKVKVIMPNGQVKTMRITNSKHK